MVYTAEQIAELKAAAMAAGNTNPNQEDTITTITASTITANLDAQFEEMAETVPQLPVFEFPESEVIWFVTQPSRVGYAAKIKEWYDKKGFVTSKQIDALRKIMSAPMSDKQRKICAKHGLDITGIDTQWTFEQFISGHRWLLQTKITKCPMCGMTRK